MERVLLNLLAATEGGQVTRAEAFLSRFRTYAPNVRLVIVKDCDSLSFIDDAADWEVINVAIGAGRLKVFRRMAWENLVLPRLMRKELLNVYLTFSHYLPLLLGSEVYSIVGVSNLAPFSTEAWNAEGNAVRFKMWLLRHTIISSSKRADQVIALSNTCKHILEKYGVEETKINVIPNGVEICRPLAKDISAYNIPLNLPYILSVSHFYKYKNFEKLVEAFSLLPQQHQECFSLIIVGKPYDAKYFDEIKGLIARLDLKARVCIIPGLDRSNLDSLYRNASLFVFTSLIENSPNILLEAMAYGLPIVASDIDPMSEFGTDAIHYFEGLSASDLASKMSEILADADVANNLRLRAKLRANDFSWDSFTKCVVNICLMKTELNTRSGLFMETFSNSYFEYASCSCCGSQNYKKYYAIDKKYIENITDIDMSSVDIGVVKCRVCRHEFISPLPTPKFLSIFYSAYMSKAKSGFYKDRVSEDIPVDFRRRYKPWLDIARGLLGENNQLLDIGAGLGMFLRLASQSGYAVHGVEPNTESAEAITEKLGVEVENNLFEDANISKRFDVITMWDLLEHLAVPRQALKKAHTLLNTEGVLILEIPTKDSLLHMLAKALYRLSFAIIKRPLYLVCGIHHLNYFDEKSVRKLLNETGFSVIKVYRGETEINSLLKNGKGLVQRTKCYLYNSALALVFFVARLVGRKNKLIVFAKKSN